MIVCSCNVLSDHEIRLVATRAGEPTLSPCQVHACLGCRVQCGRCVRAIRRIISEAKQKIDVTYGPASEYAVMAQALETTGMMEMVADYEADRFV